MKELGNEHFNIEILYDNIPTKRLDEKMETILIIGNKDNLNDRTSHNVFYERTNISYMLFFTLYDMGLSKIHDIGLRQLLEFNHNDVILK